MNKYRSWLITAIIFFVGAAAFAGPRVWRWFEAPPAGHCPICLRHEHRESMVKFQPEGERVIEACCLSCALTYGRQMHKRIRIVSVTDHETGKALAPEKAAFVVGSNVSPCTHSMVHVGEEKQEYAVRWDRCLPSILAFSSPELAEAFRAEHGGRMQTLGELMLAPPGPSATPSSSQAKVREEATCAIDGMKMALQADTPSAEHHGETYYFCSDAEKQQFLKNPARYTLH